MTNRTINFYAGPAGLPLEKDYPGMKERLSEGGKIRRFINIYVNDEDIRFVNKEATALKDGDNISIVPAIAGGR